MVFYFFLVLISLVVAEVLVGAVVDVVVEAVVVDLQGVVFQLQVVQGEFWVQQAEVVQGELWVQQVSVECPLLVLMEVASDGFCSFGMPHVFLGL